MNCRWNRLRYTPVLPLGKDGRRVTASKEHLEMSRAAASEGMVLLKNEDHALPLKHGEKVALFGKATADYVKGGGGSGEVIVPYLRTLHEGMQIKQKEGKVEIFEPLADFYEKNVAAQYEGGAQPGMTVEPEVPDELFEEAKAFADTAILSVCRFSGEGWDRKTVLSDQYALSLNEEKMFRLSEELFENGDFCLTNAEKALVSRVRESFKTLNGTQTSENADLLTKILREEWGFDGLVTTDWWTAGEHYLELKAGNDIKMGAGHPERVKEAYEKGLISREEIAANARRVLQLILKLQ